MKQIEKKKLINKKNFTKVFKYFFLVVGLLLLLAQIKAFGVYNQGDNVDLLIVGLLCFNIGLVS